MARQVSIAAMNVVVWPIMILWTLIGIILFLPGFAIWRLIHREWDSGRIMRHFVWIYGRIWMLLVSPFVPIRFRCLDVPNEIPQPAILVVNHLSFLDTYCMAALPFSNIAFAVRAWPFKMFWYAPFMRLAEYLNVEEIGWEGCLKEGKALFSRKASVLFFPEGHRSRDGKIQRFFSGPFRLSTETGVPVVPLCITGTDILLPPVRRHLKPAKVCLTALQPVNPRDFPGPFGHIAMKRHVKDMMLRCLLEQKKSLANAEEQDGRMLQYG